MIGLWMMKVGTGQVVQVVESPFAARAWSPDGRKLAFDRRAVDGSEIWMIETKGT
jgi:Tol biopolymer transport system component